MSSNLTFENVTARFFKFFRSYTRLMSSKFLQFKICSVCSLSDFSLGSEFISPLTPLISSLSKFKQSDKNEKSDSFLQLFNANRLRFGNLSANAHSSVSSLRTSRFFTLFLPSKWTKEIFLNDKFSIELSFMMS